LFGCAVGISALFLIAWLFGCELGTVRTLIYAGFDVLVAVAQVVVGLTRDPRSAKPKERVYHLTEAWSKRIR
jgi:hypothetical protein